MWCKVVEEEGKMGFVRMDLFGEFNVKCEMGVLYDEI